MAIETRNAAYNRFGTIDCEINHPVHGWIPFTASQDDPNAIGYEVWSSLDLEAVAPYVEPPADPATIADVAAERSRRLAAGFDYDFGDSRGIHRIGTSDADMRGWDEVTMLANALIAAGAPLQTIAIVTETGAVTVTAEEWNLILLAAGAARQPIWHASFVLQATDPIPADYADDSHWP